jgi:hypothetical protein
MLNIECVPIGYELILKFGEPVFVDLIIENVILLAVFITAGVARAINKVLKV